MTDAKVPERLWFTPDDIEQMVDRYMADVQTAPDIEYVTAASRDAAVAEALERAAKLMRVRSDEEAKRYRAFTAQNLRYSAQEASGAARAYSDATRDLRALAEKGGADGS